MLYVPVEERVLQTSAKTNDANDKVPKQPAAAIRGRAHRALG
jgi:hypothetical protein